MSYSRLESVFATSEVVGGKGNHLVTDCPFCNKKGHLYLNFERAFQKVGNYYIGCWDCKKCGENGALPKLLKALDRLDIIGGWKDVEIGKKIENKILISRNEELVEEDLLATKKQLPLGFKRVYEDKYLESRGFVSGDFEKYNVGIISLLSKYKKYIIIAIMEDNECKGYVGRLTVEDDTKKRYLNSSNTQFSKLLFGINELVEQTRMCILVEGLFDKFNVDKLLGLDDQLHVKCCATFGKKVSKYQIAKLQNKGIEKVILLYDPDAVKDSKKYATTLSKYFEVEVGFTKDKDPGDMDYEELTYILNNCEDPLNFGLSKIQKRSLQ